MADETIEPWPSFPVRPKSDIGQKTGNHKNAPSSQRIRKSATINRNSHKRITNEDLSRSLMNMESIRIPHAEIDIVDRENDDTVILKDDPVLEFDRNDLVLSQNVNDVDVDKEISTVETCVLKKRVTLKCPNEALEYANGDVDYANEVYANDDIRYGDENGYVSGEVEHTIGNTKSSNESVNRNEMEYTDNTACRSVKGDKINDENADTKVDIAAENESYQNIITNNANCENVPKLKAEHRQKLCVSTVEFACDVTSVLSSEDHVDIRAKTNTPCSFITNDLSRFPSGRSRATRPESRDAVYSEAVGRLSVRCVYPRGEPVFLTQTHPLPRGDTLLVKQKNRAPMPPLKAWRGYHGNVYFQPINVEGVQRPITSQSAPAHVRHTFEVTAPTRHEQSLINRSLSELPLTSLRQKQSEPKSSFQKSKSKASRRNAILEKKFGPKTATSKTSESNDNQTDCDPVRICDLCGRNKTICDMSKYCEGSKTVRYTSKSNKQNEHNLSQCKNGIPDITFEMPAKKHEQKISQNREKICKGSVAHSLGSPRRNYPPQFNVIGDKFTSAPSMSPLLLTQTQYSRSAQRLAANSPDILHMDKLPPLEQLRASLRRMDNSRDDGFGKRLYPLTTSPRVQAMVKYSRDASEYAQQRRVPAAPLY